MQGIAGLHAAVRMENFMIRLKKKEGIHKTVIFPQNARAALS
ncbi:methyltransferase FkbM family [Acetobacter orientalis]|uniref:Methyltransferase FkbM family n=1 Tax=Acetobacter orientalis TaxID=146474 RepID=A0A2Z5ZIW6_9PROT|nr:methyltransferase FkbM family [Acetobacter orientalis]